MREQIRELARRVVGKHTNDVSSISLFDEQIEQFAELVVRECIGVIGEENYTMLTGKAYCTELKRHFGVEE